jgi:DNA-binding response OmpR family regulator/signal transduction histidine kinase
MPYLPGARSEDILAIEDDPATAEVIARALDREGYHCVLALTGIEGLARLQEQPFSLVVVDKALPDSDGYQICQSVKKRDPLLPVMMIGAQPTTDDEVRGLEAGADDYIARPFDHAELLARVKTILRSRATQLFLAQYAQQLQLVSEIGHRITSILDLDRLLSEVIRLTHRAFALEYAGVGLLEGGVILWRLGWRNDCGEFQERKASVELERGKPTAPIRGLQPIEVMPVLVRAADELIAADRRAFNSRIIMPIVQSGDVLGALLACREADGYFDDKDRLIMGTLAGQLAVAVVNARLVTAQRRETQVAQMIAQAAQLMNQLQSMSEIARAIVNMLTQLAGVAHSAIGFWQQEQGESIVPSLQADSCDFEESLRRLIAERDVSPLATLLNTREPSIIQLSQGQARLQKTHAGSGAQELLVAPIQRGEQIRGALFILGTPAHHFDAYDYSLAICIAHQLAGAAESLDGLTRLQQQRGQLEAVLASMQGGVFLVDGSGQIVYCNSQLGQVIKVPAKTFLGHSYHVLFQQLTARSGNVEKARQELKAAVNQITTLPIVDLTIPRPDFLHLQLHFFPVNDGADRSIGWGGVVSDVTHERERLDRMSDLLANVSHELRTPLAAIKGFVTMLSGGYPYWGEDSQESYLRSINESADQLGRLIENVLEMARLDAGVAWLHRRSVALPSLVERAVQATRPLSRGHEFEVSITAGLPELEIDPLRIEQVLRNLLENAVDASPADRKVIVRAEPQSDEVLISIVDHGIGIPKENLTRIFDRFSQTGPTSSGQSRGAGLGLYISRELVVAHGGRIWAASEPGHGTTVYFTLPLDYPPSGNAIVTVDPDADRSAWRPGAEVHMPRDVTTLLLVEDDVPTLRVLKANLELEGFKVLTACQGRAALEMAAHQALHLVLLDLILPDLDGFQVCEQLREFSSVPIIIITGKASEQDKVRGLGVGADDYLIKPISSRELVARVRAVLRRAPPQSAAEGHTKLRFGDLILDLTHRQVYLRGNLVPLTLHEYKLLCCLAANSGRVLSHSQLLTEVWGPEYRDDRQYLWVSISRLRRKLKDDPERPRYILTDPTVGYHFCEG